MNEPWWVEGAEVHAALETLNMLVGMARFNVKGVDNTDGFCLHEQLWYDACGYGINQDAGKRIRKQAR